LSDKQAVLPEAIDLLHAQTRKGMERYGEQLMTHNGRDAREDLVQELIDAIQYQQQRYMELRDHCNSQENEIERLRETWRAVGEAVGLPRHKRGRGEILDAINKLKQGSGEADD